MALFMLILLVMTLLLLFYMMNTVEVEDVETHTFVDGVEVDPGVCSVEQIEEVDGSVTTITTFEDGTVITDNGPPPMDIPIEDLDHPENPLHDWHDDGGPVHPHDRH